MAKEKKEFNLHRTQSVPDWETIPSTEWNLAQKVAAKTKGWVTPGNLLTIGGGALFLNGLYDFTQGERGLGFVKMFVGGMADWVDGIAADKTKTKSRLGEAMDATWDKVKMGAALLALGKTGVIPPVPAITVGVQNTANAGLTVYAKLMGREVHADKLNKLNAAAQGLGLGGLVLADVLAPGIAQQTTEVVGYVATMGSTAFLGSQATYNLYKYAFNPQQPSDAA